MKVFNYTVKDELGIHARPAGLLVKLAKDFESEITIEKGAAKASCRKLMAVMAMGIKKGDTVTVTVNGPDEEKAAEEITGFFEKYL